MKKKIKISLFVFIVIGVVLLNITYKNKNEVTKTKKKSQSNLAIMIKEEGASDYAKSTSKDIPKGNYTLNREKSYCKNNGVIGNYDNTLGKVSFSFIGTDSCYLYFDYGLPGYITILNNNGGKDAIEAKGTPDFSKIADTNEGMYVAEDDLGTSYYFRGAVDNNWVKYGKYTKDIYTYTYTYDAWQNLKTNFLTDKCDDTMNNCVLIASKGDDMYWRIIRVNGDETIRMIYSGTTKPDSSTATIMTGDKTQIGEKVYYLQESAALSRSFKFSSGYMYAEGRSTQHGNETSNNIKTYIDDWYENYTDLNNYDAEISDQIFCNDRTASIKSNGSYGEIDVSTTYGDIYYGAYGRLKTNKSPTLICPTDSDKFTVNASNGNGALTYPVGLITADEVAMAGASSEINNDSYYLYTNQIYWLGSPSDYFDDDYSNDSSFIVQSSGLLSSNYVISELGIRPVISLSSSVKLSGDGTWNNVYTVS